MDSITTGWSSESLHFTSSQGAPSNSDSTQSFSLSDHTNNMEVLRDQTSNARGVSAQNAVARSCICGDERVFPCTFSVRPSVNQSGFSVVHTAVLNNNRESVFQPERLCTFWLVWLVKFSL